jgi:hypothetical protein
MRPLSTHDFLARLDNVKETKQGQWMANCPAHLGTNRKLAIKAGNPKPRVWCHSQGCSTEEVYDAVGVSWTDFYSEKASTQFDAYDNPSFVMTREMRDACKHDLQLFLIAFDDMLRGKVLSDEDAADARWTVAHFIELLEIIK